MIVKCPCTDPLRCTRSLSSTLECLCFCSVYLPVCLISGLGVHKQKTRGRLLGEFDNKYFNERNAIL